MEILCTCIFDFFREKHICRMEDLCLGSSYLYPSLKRSDDNKERCRKYIGQKSLWENEDVMIPVHLPREKHWVLVVISVVNIFVFTFTTRSVAPQVCTELYLTLSKASSSGKNSNLHLRKNANIFQEDNWEEETPRCPKQKNVKDCGGFTCLLDKNLIFAKSTEDIEQDDNIRNEMASDLLVLSTTENRVEDLPENLQWIVQNGFQALPNEGPKIKLDREITNAGLTYRQSPTPKDGNCLFHAMRGQLTRVGKAPQTTSQLRSSLVSYLSSNPTNPRWYSLP